MTQYQVGSLIFFLFAPLLIDGSLKLVFSLSQKNKREMKEIEKLASHYGLKRTHSYFISKDSTKNSTLLLTFGLAIQRKLGNDFVFKHTSQMKLFFRPNLGKNAAISKVSKSFHVERKGNVFLGTMEDLIGFGKFSDFLFDYAFVLIVEKD